MGTKNQINKRDYFNDLREACRAPVSTGEDYNEAFHTLLHEHSMQHGCEEISDRFYDLCKPALEKNGLNLNEDFKFENMLYKTYTAYQEAGFNAGHEVGFNKGMITMIRLMKLDKPKAEDILNVVMETVTPENNHLKKECEIGA